MVRAGSPRDRIRDIPDFPRTELAFLERRARPARFEVRAPVSHEAG